MQIREKANPRNQNVDELLQMTKTEKIVKKSDMSDINNSDSSSAKMFECEDDFYVTGDNDNDLFWL